jgi:glycosyltransferase involved in cell wall biosynthesis
MTKKPKIAHVVCSYPPYRGGMGNVAFEYTRRLRERGYNVHVFTSKQKGDFEDPEYVHRIPSVLQIGNAGVTPSLFKRLKGFDLIHLHYPFFGGAEPVIVRKAIQKNQGLVMTYHMDAVAGGIKGAIFDAHQRFMFPWIVGRSDRVLVSSKSYSDTSALSRFKKIQDRIEIHPFGIDLKKFFPGQDDGLKKELNISQNSPVLLFVGGLDPAHHFKGLSELLTALKGVDDLPWSLVIVGSGSLEDRYKEAANRFGIKERVHFVGNVSDEDLPRYYRAADIHVFPSTKRAEAFGIVALEAAASGIPTIASNLPGVREVVLDGDTGLLVEPENIDELKDAIHLLLENKELREKLGASARSNTEIKFSWEPLITNLENTYKSVIDQQSPREYPDVL